MTAASLVVELKTEANNTVTTTVTIVAIEDNLFPMILILPATALFYGRGEIVRRARELTVFRRCTGLDCEIRAQIRMKTGKQVHHSLIFLVTEKTLLIGYPYIKLSQPEIEMLPAIMDSFLLLAITNL